MVFHAALPKKIMNLIKSLKHFFLRRKAFSSFVLGIIALSVLIAFSSKPTGVWGNSFFVKFANDKYADLIINEHGFHLEGTQIEGFVQKTGSRTYLLVSDKQSIASIRIFGSFGFVWIEGKGGKCGILVRK